MRSRLLLAPILISVALTGMHRSPTPLNLTPLSDEYIAARIAEFRRQLERMRALRNTPPPGLYLYTVDI